VKKGLSNIVNRSKNKESSSAVTSAEVNAKKFKLAAATTSKSGTSKRSSKRKTSIEATDSLPSSQEPKIKIVVKEDDDESEYESASEDIDIENDTVVDPPPKHEPPTRPVPPPGVEDFDKENWADPNNCSEYAMDIFNYYKQREAVFRVHDYMSTNVQPEVTKMMRAILVDWLVEVQESFELNHETLYTAVKILDIYMSMEAVPKENLQLVGATACLIACKIDERIPPCLDDFVYVCDDAYSREQARRKKLRSCKLSDLMLGFPCHTDSSDDMEGFAKLACPC